MKNPKMRGRSCAGAGLLAGLVCWLSLGGLASLYETSPHSTQAQEKKAMTTRVNGEFEVKLTPQDDKSEDPLFGRMLIDKQFHGPLEAVSKGQMLAARTAVKDSAGYVAIEKVNGTLAGRAGTFALQHSGTMTRGVPSLTVTVVPDSGTGQLTGLTGSMTIRIEGGKHFYEFEYAIPAAQ
ncbi:MAG: DUF3224 domain-containing protein [Blastocatellia bacterium]|nr:DUF3224 domain-containing protein [Blastocatellia bacterium]